MKKLLGFITAGLTLTATMGVASAATTTKYVETNHGWVSYHSKARLSSPVLGRLDLGQKAPLVKKANAYWYEIDVKGKDAFITTNRKYTHVASMSGVKSASTTPTSASTTSASSASKSSGDLVATANCYLKSSPNLNPATRMGLVTKGTTMTLLGKYNSYWYKVHVNGKTGYITTAAKYVQPVSGQAHASKPATSTPAPTTKRKTSAKATSSKDVYHVVEGNGVAATINLSGDTAKQKALIKAGLSQLGVPYKLDTQAPNVGFDCSNFVAWCYKQIGISFSGSSVYQRFHVGTPVTIDRTDKTKYLHPGDLLFFANAAHPNGQGHVGIYIGNGLIIQEGGGRAKVTVESLNNSRAWFGRSLVFARRVL